MLASLFRQYQRLGVGMGELLRNSVAVVTGSGRGLGRAHALALSAEGAKVVVNDVGVELDGTGGSKTPADDVVMEIAAKGGEAIANYDSVGNFDGARRIIRTAVDHFGRLDILVNNAGIFQFTLIHETPEESWDRMLNVHLKGTFNTCRHAAPVMMAQGYGRIINTTSSQWRNPEGRVAYGAAKGGIVSITWDLAFELRNHGITVNAVAPMGTTRSTGSPSYRKNLEKAGLDRKKAPGEQGKERAGPEFVSPLIVYLASDLAAGVNGLIFRAGSGKIELYSHPTVVSSVYRDWRKDGPWTIEELKNVLPATILSGETKAPFIP